jgi:hypothetical protein
MSLTNDDCASLTIVDDQAAAEMKAKLEFEAARQQKMLKVEYEAKMQQKMKAMGLELDFEAARQQKMKAMLELEAARQQKLPQFQEPPVSVPPLGGDAGWTEAELQMMDNKTIVKVIALSSAFAPLLLLTHSTLTLYMSLKDRWFANQTRHESQPRNHHRKTCWHTTSRVLVLPRMTEV